MPTTSTKIASPDRAVRSSFPPGPFCLNFCSRTRGIIRILLAQATLEDMDLISVDKVFDELTDRCMW